MLAFMEQDPSIGIIAPQLVYEDMRPQRSFAPMPSLALELAPKAVLEALFPRFRTKGGSPSPPSRRGFTDRRGLDGEEAAP